MSKAFAILERLPAILRRSAVMPAILVFLLPAASKGAEAVDPLRLVPPSADLIVKVEHPRAIADLAMKLTSRPELAGFRGYRDYFESTNYQLLRQLVSHFERELGNRWPDLLDELAGDGIVLAVKFEKNAPAPTLVIIQGRDPALTAKFFHKALEIADQEQARQGIRDGYTKEMYRGIETLHRGDRIQSALLGAAIVYSNVPESLHAAIDLHLDPAKESLLKKQSFVDAKPLVRGDALVWGWISLDFAHKSEELKPLFTLPANFFPFQIAFGGLTDSLRRSPFIVAALREENGTGTLSVRLPGGTNGMRDLTRAHVPPPEHPGALPLLEPEGTLFSTSYYLDLAEFWKQRSTLLPKDQLEAAEQFDKNGTAKIVLYGTQFHQFLEYAGARQRFVVAQQKDYGYSVKPTSPQPAYALVLELRDPDAFAKAIDGPIRGLAFLAGFKAPLMPFEETRGKSKILGYRFVENEGNKAFEKGLLFNFSPSRARVGNQYVFSSTVELARRMVDVLEEEAMSHERVPVPSASAADDGVTLHSQLSFSGLSNYLGGTKRQLVTQNMLEQGNSPEDADKEVSLFLDLLDHLGRIESTIHYLPDQYQFDLKLVP